jgi:hypothetical protein
MTLTQYYKWLNNPQNNRVLLVILTAYDPLNQIVKNFYISSGQFYTRPTDSLPDIQFFPILENGTELSRSVPFLETKGVDDIGKIVINNASGDIDYWQIFQWKRYPVKILYGDPQWAYDDFLIKPLMVGIIIAIEHSSDKTELTIQDKLGQLDGPIQNEIFSEGPAYGEVKPICYGEVRNIKPILINENTHQYMWHNGIVNGIKKLYDKGIETTAYTEDTQTGTFTMTSRPLGTITLDGIGSQVNGNPLLTCTDIAKNVVVARGFNELNDLDLDSFNALNTQKPYKLGTYLPQRENLLDILDRLVESVSAFYLINFDGKLQVNHIKIPEQEESVFTIESYDIDELRVEPLNDIQWRVRLNYQKNGCVQEDSDLAGAITDPSYPNPARVDWLRKEYRVSYAQDSSVVPNGDYSLVTDPEPQPTLIDQLVDAQAEANFRLELLKKQRFKVTLTATGFLYQLLPGDIITVYYDRYGLDGGQKLQILKINIYPLLFRSEIEGFF